MAESDDERELRKMMEDMTGGIKAPRSRTAAASSGQNYRPQTKTLSVGSEKGIVR